MVREKVKVKSCAGRAGKRCEQKCLQRPERTGAVDGTTPYLPQVVRKGARRGKGSRGVAGKRGPGARETPRLGAGRGARTRTFLLFFRYRTRGFNTV